jgi:hypothetical protein
MARSGVFTPPDSGFIAGITQQVKLGDASNEVRVDGLQGKLSI